MKEKGRKKLIAGLASTLMFFGKNVYATSSTASTSSSGKIGFVIGLVLVLAVLTLGYKMDKNSEKEPKELKQKKDKKIKKDLEAKEDLDVSAENDMPYETESNEKYEPENIEEKDLTEDTEYEEDDITKIENDIDKLENADMSSENTDFDSTMVFSMKPDEIVNNNETQVEDEVEEEPENEDYEIGDLNAKIDELDDLDDIDESIVKEKMLELEKNNDEVENPEDFINNLKKYENDVSDFAGFTTSDEKSKEEVSTFSFGNSIKNEESQESLAKHKKYTRKKETKDIEEKTEEMLEEIPEEISEETTKEITTEENTTSNLDTGFLSQMEEQLMRNQQERLKDAKEKNKKSKK